jgi:hypothetical protein
MKGFTMYRLIDLPDGNAISPSLIKSVQLRKGKGVFLLDAQQRPVAWIPVVDEEKGVRVRDLMKRVANEGPRAQQPDWSFLESEANE